MAASLRCPALLQSTNACLQGGDMLFVDSELRNLKDFSSPSKMYTKEQDTWQL